MNNLKKIGLTALAGTLVASSAYAGSMSATGSAKLTYKGAENVTIGNGFSMTDEVTLSGGGEMDNGWNVTVSVQLDGDEGTGNSYDNRSVTIDMGDSGTVVFNGHGGSMPVNAIDDVLPTANEEAHGSIGGTEALGKGAGSDGWWKYSNSSMMDGLAVDLGYTPSGSTEFEGSVELGLTYTGVDGLTVGLATGENKAAEGAVVDNTNVYMTYALENGFTIGFQSNESDSATALADVDMTGYAVSYAMSEELTISLGRNEVGYEAGAGKSDQEATGINFSYVMGSMTLSGGHSTVDNVAGVEATDNSGYELNLAFAF